MILLSFDLRLQINVISNRKIILKVLLRFSKTNAHGKSEIKVRPLLVLNSLCNRPLSVGFHVFLNITVRKLHLINEGTSWPV